MSVKNELTRKALFILLAIIAFLYLPTRLLNLGLLPIFNDEANYLYWAKIIASTNEQWFIILTAGKPPLPHWLMVFFLKMLPSEQFLMAGRLASVLGGLFGTVGIFVLTRQLLVNYRAALIAAILYVLCPFILFYDRLALFDSLLSSMIIWAGAYAVVCSRTLKLKDAAIWGGFMGLAFLAKPNAIAYWFLLPVCFLLLAFRSLHQWKKLALLIAVSAVVAQLIHNSLIISTGYWDYLPRSLDYTNGPNSVMFADRISLLAHNLRSSLDWLLTYITWPIFVLGGAGLVQLLAERTRLGLFLLCAWLVPILVVSFFGGYFFPRYILFTTPFLLIAAAYALAQISRRGLLIGVVITLLSVLTALKFDQLIITGPDRAPLPEIERDSFITGRASSYGFESIYPAIDRELSRGKVTLLVQGGFSHFPNAFKLRFYSHKQIAIYDAQDIATLIKKHTSATKTSRVLIVFQDYEKAKSTIGQMENFKINILATGKKPGGQNSVYLAELKPL